MSLTTGNGPLAARSPRQVNYRIDGPQRLLYLDDFPRRVRALFAGATVVDTLHGRLLHESGRLPVLYVPDADVSPAVLQRTDHRTHSPSTGDATYWSVRVGDRWAENAVLAHVDPPDGAGWLRGYTSVDWDAMDAWYDEDEQVYGHLRDPYHRVDIRSTSRRVRVLTAGAVLADSTHAKVLSETGLPNRYYLPRGDVTAPLTPSERTEVCPYKGTSSYWSTESMVDVAWSYEAPLAGAAAITGHVCFSHDGVRVEVDPA